MTNDHDDLDSRHLLTCTACARARSERINAFADAWMAEYAWDEDSGSRTPATIRPPRAAKGRAA